MPFVLKILQDGVVGGERRLTSKISSFLVALFSHSLSGSVRLCYVYSFIKARPLIWQPSLLTQSFLGQNIFPFSPRVSL